MDPRFNHINVVQSPGESTYKALLLTFGKRSTNGVQYDLNYTLGKGIDTAPLAGATLSVQGDQPRSDPQDLERDKGPNALDTRHSFNGSIVAMSHFNHGADLGAEAAERQPGRRHPAVQQRPAVHADQQPRPEPATATTPTGR